MMFLLIWLVWTIVNITYVVEHPFGGWTLGLFVAALVLDIFSIWILKENGL